MYIYCFLGKKILFLRVVEGEVVTFDLPIPPEILERLDPPAPDPGMHTFMQTMFVENPLLGSGEGKAEGLHPGP